MSCGSGDDSQPNEAISRNIDEGYSISIELLSEETNQATTNISSENAGRIIVTVEQFGNPRASELVSITSTIGEIGVSNGALLTNTQGQAEVRIIASGSDGAGTITATINPADASSLSVDLNFFSNGGADENDEELDNTSISLTLVSESGTPNTIRGDDPGVVSARVITQNGTPLENEIVTFTSDLGTFNPTTGTVLTNADGIATIELFSGSTIGVSTLVASIGEEGNEVTDSINFSIQAPRIQLGDDSSGTFLNETLGLSLDTLSAGGTVSVSALIIDEQDLAFDTPVNVNFTSTCVVQDLATIDDVVTSTGGRATATYRATGCTGSDVITASIDFGGEQFEASATLVVESDTAGSIVFIEATPTTIVLAGTGGQGLSENASVTFQVFGEQGMPLANQQVEFSLTSDVGGITLSPANAISDANGFVTTSVQSGNISTSVVVIASLVEPEISTQSTSLVISSGVPDQDSMTISMERVNPEAWGINGTEVSVSAFAADHFNNPVPDGITFSFTVEGGQIESTCQTIGGSCSVTWTSQNPRPAGGFVTIMVTAIGGESFQDENGNGVFDEGDGFNDLDEAFRDDNGDEIRDFGELFIDFNNNGQFDPADGLYGGPLCIDAIRCSPLTGVTVRDSREFIMSGSNAIVTFSLADNDTYISLSPLDFTIEDINGNSMPGETTIDISSSIGELITTNSFTIGLGITRRFENTIRVDLEGVDPPSGTGFINVVVTTPAGIVTSESLTFDY